jgi:hypothetical protein
MQKIKDFLLTSLGTFGLLLFYAIGLLLTIYPLLMFEMSWWVYMLLALVIQFFVVNIPFGLEVLYIIGFFGAISGEQDIFAVIYYILFALLVVPTIIRIIKILFSK